MLRFSLILLSLVLLSCSEKIPDTLKYAQKGILLIGNSADPATLDCSLTTGLSEYKILTALFEGLVSADEKTLEIIPAIAESWEVSEDSLVYTFKLRDALWSNGEPVRASDFAFAWKRILNPTLGAQYAQMLYPIKNARNYNLGVIKNSNELGIEVVSDKILKVTLEKKNNDFLSLLYHSAYFPINEKLLERLDEKLARSARWTKPENIVTNGAFLLKEWSINEKIVLEKNSKYWDAGNVKLNGIIFFPISNLNTEDRAFFAGQLHITENISPARLSKEEVSPSGKLRSENLYGTYYYLFNVNKKPFDNPLVRRAFSLAIKRSEIIQSSLKGNQVPAYSLIPDSNIIERKNAENISLARELLAQAGYPDGKGFPLIQLMYNTSEQHKPIAESVQEMLRKNLGIEISLHNLSWPAYLEERRNGGFELIRASWIADYYSPESFLSIFLSDSALNAGKYSSKEFDECVANRDFEKAEKILYEDCAFIPIYFYKRIFLQSEYVKNWNSNLLDYHNYKNIELKYD